MDGFLGAVSEANTCLGHLKNKRIIYLERII